MLKSFIRAASVAGAVVFSSTALASTVAPVLMRFPTVSAERVAFVAQGNLWTVARKGGAATRFTDDPGQILAPHFSPNGHSIAFTWRREGGSDVYDALRDANGVLIIENRGAEPDIAVQNTPADLADGRDPHLGTADGGNLRQLVSRPTTRHVGATLRLMGRAAPSC